MHTNSGDKVFDELFRIHYPGLLYYATQFLNEAEAEDVVQDVFMEFWNRRHSLEVGDKIKAYLYRLVYTHALNVLNHKKVEARYSTAEVEMYNYKLKYYQIEENNEIIHQLENQWLNKEIESAIDNLPAKCKEVFKLSYLHDLKNKEIADILGVSMRTVEAHMYKALKTLRENLKHVNKISIFLVSALSVLGKLVV